MPRSQRNGRRPLPFPDLTDACRGLLLTTAGVLNSSGLTYYVAGGWVPLLIEPHHPTLVHPGTRDVAILMVDDLAAVEGAARALLAGDFRPSAKHEFQLLRNADAGPRTFVFNVDLMHPGEDGSEMFNDIFNLGVSDAYDPSGSRHAKSIAFRSAKIVYDQKLFLRTAVSGVDLDGISRMVDVPILNATAFLLSKCESASAPKRTWDAFDIRYVLTGTDGARHAADLRALANRFPEVDAQVEQLRAFLRTRPEDFDANVSRHARRRTTTAAAETLAAIS